MSSSKLQRTLKITEDGSHTLYVPELNEHYHSIHGAVQESMHVFIKSGLHYFKHKKELSIFEAGFGTGLNALLTLAECENTRQIINYTSIEKYPITNNEIEALNYHDLVPGFSQEFKKLHTAPWESFAKITSNFKLLKVENDLVNYEHATNYDLIFFDAFAPDLQPDLWSEKIFSALYQHLKPGGVLVTYSAKGFVKRNLKASGFTITKIPGPPGKREMIRAFKEEKTD